MIIPAIIPTSLSDLKEKLDLLSFAPEIQIDVVDGKFVQATSWPYEPQGDIAEAHDYLQGRKFEVDLMVHDAISAGIKWQSVGASRLIFHIESFDDQSALSDLKTSVDSLVGLSLNNDTPLDQIYPHIDSIDFIQLMGIDHIGSQGQPFDSRVLERIATLKALYPKLTISIDGAVNEENILSLKSAGAERFVAGSNILNAPNPKEQYEKLLKIVSD